MNEPAGESSSAMPNSGNNNQYMSAKKIILDSMAKEEARRKQLALEIPSADESVLQFAIDVMGSPLAASEWLISVNPMVGLEECPLAILKQPGGPEKIKMLLGRIEHGIP
jgi:uncharacterized protein (DUF2384 family)